MKTAYWLGLAQGITTTTAAALYLHYTLSNDKTPTILAGILFIFTIILMLIPVKYPKRRKRRQPVCTEARKIISTIPPNKHVL